VLFRSLGNHWMVPVVGLPGKDQPGRTYPPPPPPPAAAVSA